MNENPLPKLYISSVGVIHTGGTTSTTTSSVKVFTEIQMPPFPQDGLHPVHEFHGADVIGGAWMGFAVAGTYATARAVIDAYRDRNDVEENVA
jgi:hypothetical protein